MMKRCKCLPADRKALFMTMNGETVYVCTKCRRLFPTQHLPRYWDLMWISIYSLALLLLSVGLMFIHK